MSQEQNNSAAADRLLLREVSAGTGDGDSLANLNTSVLPEGSLCMVSSEHAIYELVKTGTAAALPAQAGLVIVPASGPGRWILFGVSNGLGGSVAVVSGGLVAYTANGNFGLSSSSAFTLDNGTNDHPDWTLTPLGGVLTYTGPTRAFLALLTSQVQVGDASSARDVYGAIFFGGGPSGAVAAGPYANGTHCATAAVPYSLSVARRVTLATGVAIDAQFGVAAGASTLQVNSQLMLIPQ
jgi:hypothetical protein